MFEVVHSPEALLAFADPSTCSSSFTAFTTASTVFAASLAFEHEDFQFNLPANSVTPFAARVKTSIRSSFDFDNC